MDRRKATLQAFATLIDTPPIARLHQRGRSPETAQYTIEFADGRKVRVGTIMALWSQATLARVLAVSIGCVPPSIEPGDWRMAIAALIHHATDVEEAPGERFEDAVAEWLAAYSDGATSDREGAVAQGRPFTDEDGLLGISAQDFAKYVRREMHEQVKLHELRTALADLGFERVTLAFKTGGKSSRRSTRSYYRGRLSEDQGVADEA